MSAGLTGGGTGRWREGVGELPGLGTTDGVADQHVQRFLGRLFHCCALHDKAELAAASRLAAAMGLPSHHDPQKNWDTLKCVMHVLTGGCPTLPVLDAGSSRSVIGSWLSMLGYRELYACAQIGRAHV